MSEREQRIKSLRLIDEYYWMMLRHMRDAVTKKLGKAGLSALGDGFRRFGHYRGQSLYDSPAANAEGRNAMSLLRAWDNGDLMLTQADGRMQVEGGPRRATAKLDRVPGAAYFAAQGGDKGILELYWREMLEGLASGFDDAMSVTLAPMPNKAGQPWSITFEYNGTNAGRSDAPPDDAFEDGEKAIRLSRRTLGAIGALSMYVGRALRDRFDSGGEEVLREALYNFGLERGRGMREQAERDGLPLDFESWNAVMQRRDPNASAFVFRGGRISPGVVSITCTHCPMAEVWAEEGPDGLGFGYIYDVAVHKGLVDGFHPGGLVGWEKVKTRGHNVCHFRFLIPDLVTKKDPDWAQRAAGID
jgi:hypothetical protein